MLTEYYVKACYRWLWDHVKSAPVWETNCSISSHLLCYYV